MFNIKENLQEDNNLLCFKIILIIGAIAVKKNELEAYLSTVTYMTLSMSSKA